MTLEEFFQKVDSLQENEHGCRIWTEKTLNGYGVVHVREKKRYFFAHRLVLERELGRELGEMCACHTCDTPQCVNVSHLWEGTRRDNNKDRAQKGRNGDINGPKNPNYGKQTYFATDLNPNNTMSAEERSARSAKGARTKKDRGTPGPLTGRKGAAHPAFGKPGPWAGKVGNSAPRFGKHLSIDGKIKMSFTKIINRLKYWGA